MSDFKESEHPRDADGKFTVKGKSNNRFIQWIKNQRKRLKERLSENLNKPITKITDEAIEKIKTHQIDGYTKEQCKYIAEQHKKFIGRLKNEIQKRKNQADTIRKISNKAMREGMLIWSK